MKEKEEEKKQTKSFAKTRSIQDWKERLDNSGLSDWIDPESAFIGKSKIDHILNKKPNQNTKYAPELVCIKIKNNKIISPLKKDMDFMGFSIQELNQFYEECIQKNNFIVKCLGFKILFEMDDEIDYRKLYYDLYKEFQDYKNNVKQHDVLPDSKPETIPEPEPIVEHEQLELIKLKSDLIDLIKKFKLIPSFEDRKEEKRITELARYHANHIPKKPDHAYIREMWKEYHSLKSPKQKKELKKKIYHEYYVLSKISKMSGD